LDRHRRPKLSVDKKDSPKVVQIDLAVYNIEEKLTPYYLRQFTIPYYVNRILIRNKGRSAAKNSKAVLMLDDLEYRVCWSVPTERSVAAINSNSMEYIDLSAGLIGPQYEHFKEFCERVNRLEDYIKSIKETTLKDILLLEVKKVKDLFKSSTDIPLVIAPTENDWQMPPTKNHIISRGIDFDHNNKIYYHSYCRKFTRG
ncbi:MAG: hypothetical protein WBE34_04910, partial [Candidatus Nitrosopolaris sp.]